MDKKLMAIIVAVLLIAVATAGVFLVVNNGSNNSSKKILDEELQVYGNANGDWKVDQNDVNYINDIISGKKTKTKYADANCDGVIDKKDIDQINSLIKNTAEYVWLVDGDGNNKKINRNIQKIGCEYYSNTELMLILGMKDKVYAIDNAPYQTKNFYFGDRDVKNLVNMNEPDYEAVEMMDLDILLTFSYSGSVEKQEKLSNVDVIYLGMYRPNVEEPTKSEYFQGILKAGYIFGAVDKAEAYMSWLLDIRNKINDVTSKIPDANKPRVLMSNYTDSYYQNGVETSVWSVYTSIDPMSQACMLAGGYPTAKDILTKEQWNGGPSRTTYGAKVSPESIISKKIDHVFCHCVKYTFGGVTMPGPNHGYGTGDPSEMNDAHKTACGRDLVKIKNIHLTAGDFRNGASGCILLAAYMAKILHPTLFENFDPLDYHQQYVSDWMGIKNYNIRTDAVFISPQI